MIVAFFFVLNGFSYGVCFNLRHRNAEWVGGAKPQPAAEPNDPTTGISRCQPATTSRGESHRFQWNDTKLGLAPCVPGPLAKVPFGLAIGFRYKGLVFFGGGNGWNFYNLMFEAVRTVTNTTLPGLKLKVVRRSKS